MRQIIRRKLWITVFAALVFCLPVYVYGQVALTAVDVAARCRESLDWQKSFSMRIHTSSIPLEGYSGKGPTDRDFTIRYDANTMQAEMIGQVKAVGDWVKSFNNNDPCYVYNFTKVITGQYAIEHEEFLGKIPKFANMFEKSQERLRQMLEKDIYGSPITCTNIIERSNGELYLRQNQEDINGLLCYVLEGTTQYGKVTAWIAPDKGYSPAKWVIQENYSGGSDDKITIISRTAEFEVFEFEKHGTNFIPKRAKFTLDEQLSNGIIEIWQDSYEVSEIQLNPDFPALGAFKVNLPEGTRLFSIESPGVKLVWKNSKVVPDVNQTDFDEIDKTIDRLKQQQ